MISKAVAGPELDFSPGKLRERVMKVMKVDQTVPVFSTTALRLVEASKDESQWIDTIAGIVQLDPGLTTKYLRLANSVTYGGKSISSVQDALSRIGLDEARRMAMTIGVMDVLRVFRFEPSDDKNEPVIEWEMFWLHSLYTARLTEIFGSLFEVPTGREYLGGLLHDVGKLFLDRYFHLEFVNILKEVEQKQQTFYETELQLHDMHHAQISAELCQKWHLDTEVEIAIRQHHRPDEGNLTEYSRRLALCIHLADTLANSCHANIPGAEETEQVEPESLPEWKELMKMHPQYELEVDLMGELSAAQEVIQILGFEDTTR